MGTIIGFVVGYVLGTKAGEEGYQELRRAWHTLTTSDEVKDIIAGLISTAGGLLDQGRVVLAERLAPQEDKPLRSVA